VLKNEYGIESMAHLTCVGHSKEEIDALLTSMREHNLENILALRKQNRNDFCIAAAAYVEGHVNSKRLKDDLLYLKSRHRG